MGDLETKIVDGGNGFLKIEAPFIERWNNNTSEHYHLDDSGIKKCLEEIFDVKADYMFMRTVFNPETKESLRNGFKDVRNKPDCVDVYRTCMRLLQELAKSKKIEYVSWPLVSLDCHSLDRPAPSVDWPYIHVVKDTLAHGIDSTAVEQFKSLVNSAVLSEDGIKWIRKKEAPYNYKLAEFEHVWEKKLNPLMLQEREWHVKGAELKNAVDFITGLRWYQDERVNYGPGDD